MRLTRPQLAAQQRLVALRGSLIGAEEMGVEVATALKGAAGWAGYRLFSLTADGNSYERLLAASTFDGESRLIFLRDTYGLDDPGIFASIGLDRPLAEMPRCVAVNPRLVNCYGVDPVIRAQADTRAFDDAYRHGYVLHAHLYRGRSMLFCTFPERGVPVAAMFAYRLDDAPDWPASTVAFVSLVSPLVGELLGEAIRRDLHHEALLAPAASGVLIVGQDGRVAYATPAGEQWVRALGQAHADLETGLPTSLWLALTRLRTQPTGTELQVGLRGGRARVEVAPGGPDGLAALVIAADRTPDDALRPFLATVGLTVAEERVIRLVVEGRTNRDVAEQLSVSVNTVEWHLRHVYGKLGLRNRSQLVSRFAGEVAAPGPATPAGRSEMARRVLFPELVGGRRAGLANYRSTH